MNNFTFKAVKLVQIQIEIYMGTTLRAKHWREKQKVWNLILRIYVNNQQFERTFVKSFVYVWDDYSICIIDNKNASVLQ